jgi:uncharacterized membrane protein
MPLYRYGSLHSSVFDYGLNISIFFDVTALQQVGGVFFNHTRPYILFYSYVYNLFDNSSYGLILVSILQSSLIISPVYWLKKQFGFSVAVAFLLFFPVWFNVIVDFHIDHLSVIFTFLFFLFIRVRCILWAVFSAVALAFVKEPFALQTAMCGIYMLGIHWKDAHNTPEYNLFKFENIKAYLCGIGLVIFGFSYYYVATSYIIPLYSGGQEVGLKSEAFSWLGSSITEVLWYIITHPIQIFIEIITTPGKVVYVVALFGALGFVPLLKPGPLVVALPIIAISLLSRHEGYYGLGHHYTAGLIAPMIIAFAGGLPRAKIIWQKIGFNVKWFVPILITGLVSAHIALSPSPIGRLFWSDKIWAYNYKAYIPTERDMIIKQAINDYIPTDPDTVVSIQNTVNWAPLVQRRHFLLFPQGVTEGQQVTFFDKGFWPINLRFESVTADFVVLDLKRPWYILDRGCDWLYGKCTNSRMASEYLELVDKTRSRMQVLFEKDNFIILKKK